MQWLKEKGVNSCLVHLFEKLTRSDLTLLTLSYISYCDNSHSSVFCLCISVLHCIFGLQLCIVSFLTFLLNNHY